MKAKDEKVKTILRSVRMPEALYRRTCAEAQRRGMSFNAFVFDAIRKSLGDDDKSSVLLQKVAERIKAEYPPGKDFPPNVTLKVFHHIRDDKELRKLYDGIVLKSGKKRNYDSLVPLHKNIGLLVKMLLNAKVMGRSNPIDPEENLVTTYSLLEKQ